MKHDAHFHASLVVKGEATNQVGAGPITADDLGVFSITAQSGDDLVECADARDVPEMRSLDVDEDPVGGVRRL